MRYSFVSAAVLALASSVFAQTNGFDAMTSPTQDQTVAAGSSLNIVWEAGNYTADSDTITISLLQGATPGTLSTGQVIKAGIENKVGQYTWAIPTSVPSFATYGFVITLDSNTSIFQYSYPFHITGLSSSSSSGSATGTPLTTTVKVGTGTAYTSSAPSTTVTVVSTSTSANVTSTATVAPHTSSNGTLSTTLTSAKTSATKTSSGSSSSTSSSASSTSSSAAAGNVATGGLAMVGGLIIAFAL